MTDRSRQWFGRLGSLGDARPIGSPATSVGVVLRDPRLWLLGAIGFLARGGLIVLTLAVTVLPGPVELSTIVGPDLLSGSGLSAHLTSIVVAVIAVVVTLIVAGLIASAVAETLAFDRFVRGTGVVASGSFQPRARPSLGRLVLALTSLRALVLVPAGLAIAASTARIVEVGAQEIIVPTASGDPFVLRVIAGAQMPLMLVAAAVVGAEVAASALARPMLRRAYRLPGPRRGPVATLASVLSTAFLAWLLLLAALVPMLFLTSGAWDGVREALLSSAGEVAPAAAALRTLSFTAVFLLTLLVAGLASAVRGALWDARSLR